jgi:hypothetical protein
MAPRLLERVNVPPPGCQLMGSGGPRLEKLRWSEDLWSHSALEGGGLGVRSWELGGVRHVLWVHMSWKLVCRGYRMEMCERMTWKKSIATLSIGSQSRASPAWQVWIC